MVVRWSFTEKGEDTLPILLHFIAFASKWYASHVFEDRNLGLSRRFSLGPKLEV